MSLRAVPFFGTRAKQALTSLQRQHLVGGLREILVNIWPDDLLPILALRIPILDTLTREQLVETIKHLRKYRVLMRRLSPPELEEVMAEARPDLFDLVRRDGGRPWLAAQLDDLKKLAEV